MNFKVDNSILWDNVFFIETDSGVKYVAKLEETSPGSGVWTLFFLLVNGIPNSREIFGTMNTLTENLINVLNQKGIDSLLVWIAGKDRKEIDQKTKVFLRWDTLILWKKRSRRMPALLTTTSMRPKWSMAVWMMRAAPEASDTLSVLAAA